MSSSPMTLPFMDLNFLVDAAEITVEGERLCNILDVISSPASTPKSLAIDRSVIVFLFQHHVLPFLVP